MSCEDLLTLLSERNWTGVASLIEQLDDVTVAAYETVGYACVCQVLDLTFRRTNQEVVVTYNSKL